MTEIEAMGGFVTPAFLAMLERSILSNMPLHDEGETQSSPIPSRYIPAVRRKADARLARRKRKHRDAHKVR